MMKRLGWGLLIVALLIGGFYASENYGGRAEWERVRAELLAKGEPLDPAALIPPLVPDEENLAATPLLAAVFGPASAGPQLSERLRPPSLEGVTTSFGNWSVDERIDLEAWRRAFGTNDLAGALEERYGPILAELEAASGRPQCRFPIDYTAPAPAIQLPHLAVVRGPTRLFVLRAAVRLEARDSRGAFDDILCALHLARSLESEPFLISQLVALAAQSLALGAVKDGLCARAWGEAELEAIRAEVAKLDDLAAQRRAMRGERVIFFNSMVEDMIRRRDPSGVFGPMTGGLLSAGVSAWPVWALAKAVPSGWLYRNMALGDELLQRSLGDTVDVVNHRYSAAQAEAAGKEIEAIEGLSPSTVLVRLMLPAVASAGKRFALGQTGLDMALIACALEQYRLAHGALPPSLEALAEPLPHDIMSGKPYGYRQEADGGYVLYSVGWNEVDDGGTMAVTTSGSSRNLEYDKGDWVWRVTPPGAAPEAAGP